MEATSSLAPEASRMTTCAHRVEHENVFNVGKDDLRRFLIQYRLQGRKEHLNERDTVQHERWQGITIHRRHEPR